MEPGTADVPTYDAVVVAGGAARRFGGADKTRAVVDGVPMLDRVLAAVSGAGRRIVVAHPRPVAAEVAWARENPPGSGPANAIVTGLAHVRAPYVVLLAADLPYLGTATVRRLLIAAAGPDVDGAVLRDPGGRLQHLCCAVRTAPLRTSAAAGGWVDAPVRRLLASLALVPVDAIGDEALDVDEPADLPASVSRCRPSEHHGPAGSDAGSADVPVPFVKRRAVPEPGSIPAVLGMFEGEVRFYREIAPMLGTRVPQCFRAESSASGTLLELEDLSGWMPGADPAAAAVVLGSMHARWRGRALDRWPWLRSSLAGVDLIADLFDTTWPTIEDRPDCPASVKQLGKQLTGRVREVEEASAVSAPETLIHGDASLQNMRTSPSGLIALLDWEDVSWAPAATDLAWLLVSSVEVRRWDEVINSYGDTRGLVEAFPPAAVQGLLSFADTPIGSDAAGEWARRLAELALRLLT